MIDLSTPIVSPEIKPGQPAQGITHARQGRQPPRPRSPKPAPMAMGKVPLWSKVDGAEVVANVPLVWPSIVEHQPDVNLSITRFLFALQHVSDTYEKWGRQEANSRAVKSAFNEMVAKWNEVEDAFGVCCTGTNDSKDIHEGLATIKVICGTTLTFEGPNWVVMRESRPAFQAAAKDKIIGSLKSKRHIEQQLQ